MTVTVSVVIPCKNSAATLERCLRALCQEQELLHEIVVVDDGSTDNSARIAAQFPLVRMVQTEETHRGVACARNKGATEARGVIVLFVDADVVVNAGSIAVVQAVFRDPTVHALVGLLDPNSEFRNFASDYKNLWMHYTYKILPSDIALFYTSIAAIRRSLFVELGGFDTAYRKPGLEDTAFGNTLFERGYSVRLVPELQAVHVKYYTVRDILKLDYQRAKALVKIQLRKGLEGLKSGNKSSVPGRFILSIVPGCLTTILVVGFLLFHQASLLIGALLSGSVTILLNSTLLNFLFQVRGLRFTVRSMLFLLVDSNVLAAGTIIAFIEYFRGKRY